MFSSSSSVTRSTDNLAKMNEFASREYLHMVKDFNKHTKMIKEMKQDLDWIFQKIRYGFYSLSF